MWLQYILYMFYLIHSVLPKQFCLYCRNAFLFWQETLFCPAYDQSIPQSCVCGATGLCVQLRARWTHSGHFLCTTASRYTVKNYTFKQVKIDTKEYCKGLLTFVRVKTPVAPVLVKHCIELTGQKSFFRIPGGTQVSLDTSVCPVCKYTSVKV